MIKLYTMTTIKNLVPLLVAVGIITSCGDKNNPDARKKEIEKLKAQRSEIEAKIKNIEDELRNGGVKMEDSRKIPNVAVTTLSPQSFEHSIDVQGRVDGDEIVTISAKTAGTIRRVLLSVGDHV